MCTYMHACICVLEGKGCVCACIVERDACVCVVLSRVGVRTHGPEAGLSLRAMNKTGDFSDFHIQQEAPAFLPFAFPGRLVSYYLLLKPYEIESAGDLTYVCKSLYI